MLAVQSLHASEALVASITIRNLDDRIKARLRIRAARHGRSMEEEARTLLRAALKEEEPAGRNLADAIQARFGPLGGVELPVPAREAIRVPPRPRR
jgi:antitoxin FitA